ncbi:MAG: ABC transporter transmembrane domain-containing protein [Desulfuromonadaceae bacterium]|nr:ABC transporter transmembrane domain-containing protein [Desulfuromonadaceae bacterium]
MKKDSLAVYKRLLRYSRAYLPRITIAMIASIGVAASDVAVAKLVQPLVDHVLAPGGEALIHFVPLIVIGLALLKGGSRYVQEFYIKTAGQLVVQDLRNDLYAHTLRLSMGFYSRVQSGTLVSRIINDVATLQKSAADELVAVVREGLTLIGLVVLLFYNDWRLALVAFVVLPVAIVPATYIGRRIKRYVHKSLVNIGNLTGILQEAFGGIKVVKAFGTEEHEKQRFELENHTYYRRIAKMIRYDSASSPIVELLSSFGAAGVLWYGLNRVMQGHITQGELLSFITAMGMMYGPLKRLVKTNNVIQKAVGAAERVFSMMDTPVDLDDAPNAQALGKVKGHVVFDHVDFGYAAEVSTAEFVDGSDAGYAGELVLHDFNLDVKPGTTVALVGASGAGKSTVIGLLARFYDPIQGRITIDGKDISSVTQKSLKQQIALVDQEIFLFHDTIANNIRYARPDASDAEVWLALEQAYAADFIRQMPQGLETVIGDRGVRLSGGQRQRLSIARAILRDASILLLDEATSALDTQSETVVQDALENLMRGRTTFVIAHRLSTVMHADEILVMQDGRIVERGSHAELFAVEGYYFDLHQTQFRG